MRGNALFYPDKVKKQLHLLKQWDIDTSKNWLDLKKKNSCFSFWLFYVPCSSLAPFANFIKVRTKEAGFWFPVLTLSTPLYAIVCKARNASIYRIS